MHPQSSRSSQRDDARGGRPNTLGKPAVSSETTPERKPSVVAPSETEGRDKPVEELRLTPSTPDWGGL
jgi:hypothetical protein